MVPSSSPAARRASLGARPEPVFSPDEKIDCRTHLVVEVALDALAANQVAPEILKHPHHDSRPPVIAMAMRFKFAVSCESRLVPAFVSV